ncbi:MAG TPA: helix-turn-helix transcriptional regulator [Candidatus Avacidaminococcus intestinavium]|uniref:Helix-turn-helix transcriptional regulator n=1 Tax=Candidatus Avacidaminococcus intestinavium TaxID=2840684 RepID=A0A9D1SKN6_9FIRM|nr:helix-turn-helix transcriptional regulator [Candidatus Avacidaminococcus intestinavium]
MKRKLNECEMLHIDIVKVVRSQMYAEPVLDGVSNLFKIMGDKTRCNILCALSQNELCVCALTVLLDMSKSAISHQLRVLREAKLVRSRREGKNVYYSLDDDHVKDIFRTAAEHVSERE